MQAATNAPDVALGPAVQRVHEAVIDAWPEHAQFLNTRFGAIDPIENADCEELARLILLIADGELATYANDYRWMCNNLLLEDVYFRRHGRYRFSTPAEFQAVAARTPDYMSRYMRGLLLSQLLWANQSRALSFYRHQYLSGNQAPYSHLEVGPGHGLLVYFASQDPRCSEIAAWDLSADSLSVTGLALRRLGVSRAVDLSIADIETRGEGDPQFDSVVASEVLEHLERPAAALRRILGLLRPDGRAFFNVPVNSPAPDHFALFRTPQEVIALVEGAGFLVEAAQSFPATGYDEATARTRRLTISCAIIARRRA